MREIRFRVWIENTLLDSINYKIDLDGQLYWIDEFNHHIFYNDNNYIIEQYTGLKDKNGVEIYEGDIVEIDLNSLGVKRCVVVYRADLMRFVFDNPKNVYLLGYDVFLSTHIKAVGNIHKEEK